MHAIRCPWSKNQKDADREFASFCQKNNLQESLVRYLAYLMVIEDPKELLPGAPRFVRNREPEEETAVQN